MIEINLLPWRQWLLEKRRKDLQKIRIVVVNMSVILILMVHAVINYYSGQEKIKIAKLQQDLFFLQGKTESLKKLNQECDSFHVALEKMKEIDIKQSACMEIFNKLGTATPSQIIFSDMMYQEGKFILFGLAPNSFFLNQLFKIFENAKIISIQNQPHSSQLKFQFQVSQNEKQVDVV